MAVLADASQLVQTICAELPVIARKLCHVATAACATPGITASTSLGQEQLAHDQHNQCPEVRESQRLSQLNAMKSTIELVNALSEQGGRVIGELRHLLEEKNEFEEENNEQSSYQDHHERNPMLGHGQTSHTRNKPLNFLAVVERRKNQGARKERIRILDGEFRTLMDKYNELSTVDNIDDVLRNVNDNAHYHNLAIFDASMECSGTTSTSAQLPSASAQSPGLHAIRAVFSMIDSAFLKLEAAHQHLENNIGARCRFVNGPPDTATGAHFITKQTTTLEDVLHRQIFFTQKLQVLNLILGELVLVASRATTTQERSKSDDFVTLSKEAENLMYQVFLDPFTVQLIAPCLSKCLNLLIHDQLNPAARSVSAVLYVDSPDFKTELDKQTLNVAIAVAASGHRQRIEECHLALREWFESSMSLMHARDVFEKQLHQAKMSVYAGRRAMLNARTSLYRESWICSPGPDCTGVSNFLSGDDSTSFFRLSFDIPSHLDPRDLTQVEVESGLAVEISDTGHLRSLFLKELKENLRKLAHTRQQLLLFDSQVFSVAEDQMVNSFHLFLQHHRMPPNSFQAGEYQRVTSSLGKRRLDVQIQIDQTAHIVELCKYILDLEHFREGRIVASYGSAQSDNSPAKDLQQRCRQTALDLMGANEQAMMLEEQHQTLIGDLEASKEARQRALESRSALEKMLEKFGQTPTESTEFSRELQKLVIAKVDAINRLITALVPELRKIFMQDNQLYIQLRPLLSTIAKLSSVSSSAVAARAKQDTDKLHFLLKSFIGNPSIKVWEKMGAFAIAPLASRVYHAFRDLRSAADADLTLLTSTLEAEGDGDENLIDEPDEEVNRYALSAIKRVKGKLIGLETESYASSSKSSSKFKTISVDEQVEWMIGQATSESNLSQLYEGWAPWI